MRACSLLVLLAAGPLAAQLAVPYPLQPTWQSDRPGVSTGGAFADLDRDGYLDVVIANGNDMQRQNVVVYRGGPAGFAVNPTWRSNDVDYHGHLDVGDVNGDGFADVVVAVFLGPNGFGDPGRAKLYLNDGQGHLGATPAWTSSDRFMSFSVALGDVDLDGDLDLAVATGEPYSDPPDYDRVYLNTGGTFSGLPSWTSAARTHSMDVGWCDVDGDGDLDLAFAGAAGPNRVHFNVAGVLQPAPGWTSTDNAGRHNSNSLAFGDVDGDGRPDMAISDNSQLTGGRGTFRVYRNLGATFTTTPWWESARFANGYTSAVTFVDFDLDGDLDLIGGGWWTTTAVYRNDAGRLTTTPVWQTAATSVVEALFWGDVDRDGLRAEVGEVHAATGGRLFACAHGPVQALDGVVADGQALAPGQYSFHRESGLVTLAATPATQVALSYRWTEAPDLGISNWDNDKGNYLYLRRPVVDLIQTPPVTAQVRPGGAVAWTDRVESTVAVAEPITYCTELVLPAPFGSGTLYLVPVAYPAGWNVPLVQSLAIPAPFPPVLLGSYTYRARILGRDGVTVLVERSFPFQIVP